MRGFIFQNTVDKILKKTNLALVIGTNSWREQFVDAITVNSGENSRNDSAVTSRARNAGRGEIPTDIRTADSLHILH